MHSFEESLLQSRHSVGSETGTASGREKAIARGRQKVKERASNEYNRMYVIEESLLRSRRPVGSKLQSWKGNEKEEEIYVQTQLDRSRKM
jgi:hypothetical protein